MVPMPVKAAPLRTKKANLTKHEKTDPRTFKSKGPAGCKKIAFGGLSFVWIRAGFRVGARNRKSAIPRPKVGRQYRGRPDQYSAGTRIFAGCSGFGKKGTRSMARVARPEGLEKEGPAAL